MATLAPIETPPPPSGMSKYSGNVITGQFAQPRPLDAAKVAEALDSSQMHLRRPALPTDTVIVLSVDWAEQLAVLGVTDSQVKAVFWEALNCKPAGNDYPLSWIEIRDAALRVVKRELRRSSPQSLDDGDCDFLLSMLLPWLECHDECGNPTGPTPQSIAYVRELRAYFRAFARTDKELKVLARLETLPLD